jgi:hypothetical protein
MVVPLIGVPLICMPLMGLPELNRLLDLVEGSRVWPVSKRGGELTPIGFLMFCSLQFSHHNARPYRSVLYRLLPFLEATEEQRILMNRPAQEWQGLQNCAPPCSGLQRAYAFKESKPSKRALVSKMVCMRDLCSVR